MQLLATMEDLPKMIRALHGPIWRDELFVYGQAIFEYSGNKLYLLMHRKTPLAPIF